MEAKDSATSSYAWKSILKGREVIQMGARFRVGIWKKYQNLAASLAAHKASSTDFIPNH